MNNSDSPLSRARALISPCSPRSASSFVPTPSLESSAFEWAPSRGSWGGWHKALVVGSVSLWQRLLASRLWTFCYDTQAFALLRASAPPWASPCPWGGGASRMHLLPMASSPDGLISAQDAVITKTPGWEVLTTTSTATHSNVNVTQGHGC